MSKGIGKRGLSRRDFLKLGTYGSAGALLGMYGGVALGQRSRMAETSRISFATFNVNWANNVFNEVADHFGWLEEEGIISQRMRIVEQLQIFPEMINSRLNFAAQDTDAIANANIVGEPIKLLANYRWTEPWILAVSEDIESVEDLYGKAVSGGGTGGRNEWNAKAMIERLGGDPDEITWEPISGGSDARVNAFIQGEIAGVVMFDRHREMVEDAGGWLIYDELEEVPQDGYCAHEDWIAENERTVIGFLKATTLARQFVMDLENKDEVIDIMRSRGYEMNSTFIRNYRRQLSLLSPTGQFDPEKMEKLIAESVRNGSIAEEIHWSEFTAMEYLNTAYKELDMEDMVVDYSVEEDD